MQIIKQSLLEKYHLNNFQIAQLLFLGKTIASEISKIIIIAIIFHQQLDIFLFALVILVMLRCSTGGIHFYTYIKCLAGSILYFGLALILLPHIPMSHTLKILFCLLCVLICYVVGPVPSRYRPPYTNKFIKHCKIIITTFLLLYTFILHIIPKSQYVIVGFWIIILHSLQLLTAKYIRKLPVYFK